MPHVATTAPTHIRIRVEVGRVGRQHDSASRRRRVAVAVPMAVRMPVACSPLFNLASARPLLVGVLLGVALGGGARGRCGVTGVTGGTTNSAGGIGIASAQHPRGQQPNGTTTSST